MGEQFFAQWCPRVDMDHTAHVRGVGVSINDGDEVVPAVVLEARDELVPIFVSFDQAQAIQLAIRDIPFERPLTHDLLVDMVTEFGGAIDAIRIDDLDGGTFYAKIDVDLYRDDGVTAVVFDARPSDGIAIALRADCPISISDAVLDDAGRSPDELELHDTNLDDVLDW